MPVIRTYCSAPIEPAAREALKAAYGQAIEAVPGKSEAWLMCLFEGEVPIYLAGDDSAPSALVTLDVFARGEAPHDALERFTEKITPVVARELGVDPTRIYIVYAATPDFGWNGSNL